MNWFSDLVGFFETPADVYQNISVAGEWMTSKANGKRYRSGILTIPSLASVREQVLPLLSEDQVDQKASRSTLREVVANVQTLHCDPANQNAIFQVASQCNLLEMVGPSVTPEQGVTGYAYDRTQGPACAIAAGAGTIYRNYFVPVGDQIGQTASKQVDTMMDLEQAFESKGISEPWRMQNGYVLPTALKLSEINEVLSGVNRDQYLSLLRIGVHRNVEVTIATDDDNAGPIVHQLYCSAMPVAYSRVHSQIWEPLGRLVLDAAYELTLLTAVQNAKQTGQRTVYLTLLGGGAFGNPTEWITDAILRAMKIVEQANLDVVIVSYGRSSHSVQNCIAKW